LLLAILGAGVQQVLTGVPLSYFLSQIVRGVVFPTLPNGGWSITVEFHFYLVLPLLLWMLRRSGFLPLMVIAAAIALRCFIYYSTGEAQSAAYWTIIGRVDQFALGMLAFRFGGSLTRRHAVAIGTMVAFMAVYWLIDSGGGFYQTRSYPSTSPLWIFLTTVEGIAYAVGIAWYDNSFAHSTSGVSRFIGRLGEYSYSIYLLHFFVVFEAARFVNERVMSLSNFYLACAWAAIFCVLMMIPGWLSFRLIEGPSLKLRRRYVV
jgi:peptidoglycan/LPS O-acetylase OafA/YrhL